MSSSSPAALMKALCACQPPWSACKISGVVGLSVFTLVFAYGSCLMWFTDVYVDSILNAMTIRPESSVYEAWRKPPVKPLICLYVFNYTNVDRYALGLDERIKLVEAGPYCYRETLEKKNITFNEDGTITYGDTRRHEFEPTKSNGSMDDILVVPNLALISAMGALRSYPTLFRYSASIFLQSFEFRNTMMSVRAHDFFFGYDDKLLKSISQLAGFLGQEIPFDKFGLLSRRAAITEETITVRTGTGDLERIGVVTAVDGNSELTTWPEAECNRIDGSDGAFFPRHGVNESATIYLFHRDLCRRIPFIFSEEVDFQDGIMAMRFVTPDNVYDTNGTCYCTDKDNCSPKGVFDLSPCSFDAPIMMSFPHFLNGDPALLEPFDGLNPQPNIHKFHIDVQRLLGFTLGTVSRLQLNLQVHKLTFSTLLSEFPDNIILPIVWIQVSAERMPPDLFNLIYHATFTVQRIQVGLRWGLICTTIILCCILYVVIRKGKKHKKGISDKEKGCEAAQEMLNKKDGVPVINVLRKD